MKASEFDGRQNLIIFDIDDTLLHTTARINVIKNGQKIKSLSNQQFNDYTLSPGESFDFGEFKDAEKFQKESQPIERMIRKLKKILTLGKNSKVIMLTARSDFDNKQKVLDTFNQLGVDMSRVHLHRAGNISGDLIPAEKKAVWVRKYLSTGNYKHVRLYDDSMTNLRVFKSLEQEYPTVDFKAVYVGPGGSTTTIEQELAELSFLGSPCTKDCSGHRAGYEWFKRKNRVPYSWSPSFNNGAALAAQGK